MFFVSQFSSNMHDKSVEAAMTGAFFFGPLAAAIGFLIGLVRSKPRQAPTADSSSNAEHTG